MSIPEAIKGARAELANISSPIEKIRRIATYSRIFGAELVGSLAMIPYGVRAWTLYQGIPSHNSAAKNDRKSLVSISRDVRYGPNTRNTLDIYIPEDEQENHDFVLFCHGGVWASGSKWHYSPLGTRLAQAGIITGIMEYTLYPETTVPEMTLEVNQALSWIFDNIHQFKGDETNISLIGHSSGAHLGALSLLHRASSLPLPTPPSTSRTVSIDMSKEKKQGIKDQTMKDGRMPKRFIGMAGCYHIDTHYQYEKGRNVHKLSTMERAVGGRGKFDESSPTVLLERKNILLRKKKKSTPTLTTAYGIENEEIESKSLLDTLTLQDAQKLPSCFLLSSTNDYVVPWQQSHAFYLALRECGVPARNLVYNQVGHGDFVVGWHSLDKKMGMGDYERNCPLKEFAQDLIDILLLDE